VPSWALLTFYFLCIFFSCARAAFADDRLFEAIRADDVPAVRQLIRSGIDIERRDQDKRTPLMLAVRNDRVEIARLLIGAGSDPNARDELHDTPYLFAAAEGRTEILRSLLAGGANLLDTNRFGGTGLIPAAHHGHADVVRLLLATDIDVDHVNNLGWTALLEAVILGDGGPVYQEIVGLLLKAGARRDITDRDGMSPLDHARRLGYRKIAALLEQG